MQRNAGRAGLSMRDVIFVCLVSVLFGVVYLGAVYLSSSISTVLTPIGLQAFTYEVIFGVWFMASTFIGYLLRRPGVALVTEMLAALVEVLLGSFFGPMVLVAGLVQGLGAEIGFAIFGYRRWDATSMFVAAAGCTVTSFAWGFYRSGFSALSIGLLIAMFVVRLISSLIFSGWLSKRLADELVRAGVVSIPTSSPGKSGALL